MEVVIRSLDEALLAKARAGLRPEKVTVRGKTKVFQAIRYKGKGAANERRVQAIKDWADSEPKHRVKPSLQVEEPKGKQPGSVGKTIREAKTAEQAIDPWKNAAEAKEGHKLPDGTNVRIYDIGDGKEADRYTAVLDSPEWNESTNPGMKATLGFSGDPTHPQGISQFGEGKEGPHLGKRIPFSSLPKDLQDHVVQRTQPESEGVKEQGSFYFAEPKEKTTEEKNETKQSRVAAMEQFASALKDIPGVESSALDDYTPSSAEEGTIFIKPKVKKMGSSSGRMYNKYPWEFDVKPVTIANSIKRIAKKMGMSVTEIQVPRKTYHKDKYGWLGSKPVFDGYDESSIRVEMYPIGKSIAVFSIDEAYEDLEKAGKLGMKRGIRHEKSRVKIGDLKHIGQSGKDIHHMRYGRRDISVNHRTGEHLVYGPKGVQSFGSMSDALDHLSKAGKLGMKRGIRHGRKPGGGAKHWNDMRQLSVPEQHQLRIVTDNLRNPLKGKFLGGPTGDEAKEIYHKLTGRAWAEKSILSLDEAHDLMKAHGRVKTHTRRTSHGISTVKEHPRVTGPFSKDTEHTEFEFKKMMALISNDAFLQNIYNKKIGDKAFASVDKEHQARIMFNTYVKGDSVMERRYSFGITPGDKAAPKVEQLKAPYTAQGMEHERMRMRTMSDKALITRAWKITDPNKLFNFFEAAKKYGSPELIQEIQRRGEGMGLDMKEWWGRYENVVEKGAILTLDQAYEDLQKGRGPDKQPRRRKGVETPEATEQYSQKWKKERALLAHQKFLSAVAKRAH